MASNGQKKGSKNGEHHDDHGKAKHDSHHEEEHHEVEHEEGEPWLVSYADMMTLLFGFFVVMYSFASKNPKSQEYIKMKLEQAFTKQESVEGMNIVELTERLVKIMAKNVEQENKEMKSAGIREGKNDNTQKKINTEKVSTMVESLKVLLAGIDKDIFEKDEKQAAIFENLKERLDERLGSIQIKNEGKDPYSAISISLALSDMFSSDNSINAVGKDVLNRVRAHARRLDPKPQVRIEVYSEDTSRPAEDLSKTMKLATEVNQYLLSGGMDPSLLSSASYGSLKPLVDYVDKNGAIDKAANYRNNRIIIIIEKRLVEKNKPKM
jgi:chemotaxis protein MotB